MRWSQYGSNSSTSMPGAGVRRVAARPPAEGLPPDVTPARRAGPGPYDVILLFCADRARLVRRWPVLHARTTPAGALWVAWPKRASGIPTDLDDNVVREHASPTEGWTSR